MESSVLDFAPRPGWSDTHAGEHFVQFYESDAFLLDALTGFVARGLRAGDAVIVVATTAHREALLASLHADGLDVSAEISRGRYVPLDAADLLLTFMEEGTPNPTSFTQMVGGIIARAARSGNRVCIFGEMVNLLWAAGNYTGAMKLEGLWNELRLTHPFSLFCSYRLSESGDGARLLADICATHSSVIPAESYSALGSAEERLRAIVRLQGKAAELDSEIAERKVAEERFRLLAESMPEKIFTARPNGELDYCNAPWTEYTGVNCVELNEAGWARVIHPDDLKDSQARWQHSIATGDRFEIEHRLRRADGVDRWHLTRAHAMPHADGTVLLWIGSHTDIDDQKRREAVLDRSIRQRDEFLSAISHDLKTPLTVLRGQAQMLQRRIVRGALDETQLLHGLEQIEDRSRAMAKLFDELLDVTRLRAGEVLQFDRAAVDLLDLAREVVAGVTSVSPGHHIVVHSPERELIGFWDRIQLQRVLENLLNNAIKYSPEGSTIDVSLSAETGEGRNHVLLTVEDHGMGIATDEMPHIFERFYRGRNARGGMIGTGLGLAGVRQIVEQHGGTIGVVSRERYGSTFSVRLPCDAPPETDTLPRT